MLTHKHSQRSTASAQTNSPTRRRRLTWRDCSRGQVTGWAVCTANTPTNTPRCSCNKQTNMQQQIHCSSASGESAALSSASTDVLDPHASRPTFTLQSKCDRLNTGGWVNQAHLDQLKQEQHTCSNAKGHGTQQQTCDPDVWKGSLQKDDVQLDKRSIKFSAPTNICCNIKQLFRTYIYCTFNIFLLSLFFINHFPILCYCTTTTIIIIFKQHQTCSKYHYKCNTTLTPVNSVR